MVCKCQAGSVSSKLTTPSLRVRFFILPVISQYWLKLPRSTAPQGSICTPIQNFQLVRQRMRLSFWPVTSCSENDFNSGLWHILFKIFTLHYHNKGPWLYKSLNQFNRTKQKVDFICIAPSYTHAHKQVWSSIVGLYSFLCSFKISDLSLASQSC